MGRGRGNLDCLDNGAFGGSLPSSGNTQRRYLQRGVPNPRAPLTSTPAFVVGGGMPARAHRGAALRAWATSNVSWARRNPSRG